MGGYNTVLKNQTAYFQTEVIFDDPEDLKPHFLYVGIENCVKRAIAANRIQRWYRAKREVQASEISLIKYLKIKRSKAKI